MLVLFASLSTGISALLGSFTRSVAKPSGIRKLLESILDGWLISKKYLWAKAKTKTIRLD